MGKVTNEKAPRYVRFRAEYLPMLAKIAAASDARTYLTRIHAQPHADGGVLLTVSDGHRLLIIHDKSGEANGTYVLSIEPAILAVCRKPPKKQDCWPRQACWIGGRSGYYTMPLPEGQQIQADQLQLSALSCANEDDSYYPDIAKILPKAKPEQTENASAGDSLCVVNPKYLSELASIVPAMSTNRLKAITLIPSANSILIARFDGIELGDQCYAMVMGLNAEPVIGIECDFYKPAGLASLAEVPRQIS